MIQNNFNDRTIKNESELWGWDIINAVYMKRNYIIGGKEGREKKDRKLRDFVKQFFPGQVNLALEGIYGRGCYNWSGEPVLKTTISFENADLGTADF